MIVISCTATSIPILIAGNAFIGISSAPQQNATTIVSELIPNKYRGLIYAVILVSVTPLIAFGPVFMRLFILHTTAGWRWAYYLNVTFGGLSLILYILCYHPPTYSMLHANRKKNTPAWKMVDWVGSVLFIAGLVLL